VEQVKSILLLIPFIAACSFTDPNQCKDHCIVKVPVYEKPKFDIPNRPVLRDTIGLKTEGEIVRAVELNTIELMTYSQSLEELLKSLK
jgi:hypothetical protein